MKYIKVDEDTKVFWQK